MFSDNLKYRFLVTLKIFPANMVRFDLGIKRNMHADRETYVRVCLTHSAIFVRKNK